MTHKEMILKYLSMNRIVVVAPLTKSIAKDGFMTHVRKLGLRRL